VGIYPSLDALRAARRVAAQLQVRAGFVVGDARALPFAAGTFDVAFSYSVLQHFDKVDARDSLVFSEVAAPSDPSEKKHTWPCPGKPEERKGQPIGMYHCEFCGEMQIAGLPHVPPQFPSQWREPFPKVEDPEEPTP